MKTWTDTSQRVAVLLGAGASADAGLPMSHQFAEILLREMAVDLRANSPVLMAANFVYGAMVNHRTETGGDPFAAVNVETMISAIRLLAGREGHEAAPFVERWKAGANAFPLEYSWAGERGANELVDALRAAFEREYAPTDRIARAVLDIAAEGAGIGDNAEVFREIERELLPRVRKLLLRHESVEYLNPLVELAEQQPGGVDVATLNYDLTVEYAAAALGVQVDLGQMRRLGIVHSDGSHDGVLRLFKLHGSIDWKLQRIEPRPRELGRKRLVRRTDPGGVFIPAIVIGDRDKLGTDGPTLGLLAGFSRALERAGRLVIVGYAFADQHVNRMIRDWLNEDGSRTVTVLDPSFERGRTTFANEIARQLAQTVEQYNAPRLNLVPQRTADGLSRALSTPPTAEPRPRFSVTATVSGVQVLAKLSNQGSVLNNVRFDVPFAFRPPITPSPRDIALVGAVTSEVGPKAVHLKEIEAGGTVLIMLTFASLQEAALARLHVAGADLLDDIDEWYELRQAVTT